VVSGFDDKTTKEKRWIWLEESVGQALGAEKRILKVQYGGGELKASRFLPGVQRKKVSRSIDGNTSLRRRWWFTSQVNCA
jgi:hypothetical protein